MNWDICDYTKNWKFVLETNLIDGTLHFPLVNHSFAHLISTCDGIALGINKGYSTFSFMNYDVVDFCIEQLPHHITEIKKNNTDSIFYPFKIKNFMLVIQNFLVLILNLLKNYILIVNGGNIKQYMNQL